jgi:hypothetical protein
MWRQLRGTCLSELPGARTVRAHYAFLLYGLRREGGVTATLPRHTVAKSDPSRMQPLAILRHPKRVRQDLAGTIHSECGGTNGT